MVPGCLVSVPELANEGIARLLNEKGVEATIRFLGSGAEMTVEQRRAGRHCLLPGTRIRVSLGGAEVMAEVRDGAVKRDPKTNMLVYGVRLDDGRDMPLREDSILQVPLPTDPLEQLITVQFHDLIPGPGRNAHAEPRGPQSFTAREELLTWRDQAWSATGGVVGLAGARVTPLPHQLLVAQRALNDRQIRYLLADEVGLGKTIEAGLVVQSLLAMRPNLRVLVVVPGALVSQWFLELYVRFGGRRFVMLDQERLRTWNGNPWKDEPFVLASSRAIEEMDPKSALRLAQSSWDVLVVDECHRMQPGGVLYKRIAVLSKATPHVLLLSATPPRHHPDAHLALLSLLQPQVYRIDEKAAFAAKLDAHERIAALMEHTIDSEREDAASLASTWKKVLGANDSRLVRLADAIANCGKGGTGTDFDGARKALMAHVRATYALDQRVVRHRRAVLAKLAAAAGTTGPVLATRTLERISYKPDAVETKLRAALRDYATALIEHFEDKDGNIPPRLAHWLLQLELAVAAHPRVIDRLLAMRAAVLENPEAAREYAVRVQRGETTAQVLRSDLSESELATHIAISAACNIDAEMEEPVLADLRAAAEAWDDATPARTKALMTRLVEFWKENPQEKVLVFTSSSLAVRELASIFEDKFGDEAVETFGAHQDTVAREEAARRFKEDDRCPLMVCDPLGGEGRNFQFVSIIVHHDPAWSVAAIEQRIGRVDRIGRDGDVPSWVPVPTTADAIDGAWVDVLDGAAQVFTASSSGLEFVSGEIEVRALEVALRGGGKALRKELPAFKKLVEEERSQRDDRAEELFHADTAEFAAASALADTTAALITPRDAVCRWVRAMGGSVKRDDEGARAFHLRLRHAQQPVPGVFDRERALAHHNFAFFALGHDVVDAVCDDAAAATWCGANAWRRSPTDDVKRWEGLRVTWAFTPDLTPIAAADLKPEDMRRLLMIAPPKRMTIFVRGDGVVETDPTVLAVLTPPFDAKNGDVTLSRHASREFWTRPMLMGKHEDVQVWQAAMRTAAAGAKAYADAHIAEERAKVRTALDKVLAEGLENARAVAAAAGARLGGTHPDAMIARSEVEWEEKLTAALTAAVDGARFDITGVAYVAVA
jgi:superfamily II DNA or RNA helicase